MSRTVSRKVSVMSKTAHSMHVEIHVAKLMLNVGACSAHDCCDPIVVAVIVQACQLVIQCRFLLCAAKDDHVNACWTQ